MTEKRFTLTHINEQYLSANLYDNGTFIGSIGIGAELIVELLNNLSEENEELKEENKWLKSIHFASDVLKENKELKQEIETLHEQLAHIGDVFE